MVKFQSAVYIAQEITALKLVQIGIGSWCDIAIPVYQGSGEVIAILISTRSKIS